MIRRLLVIIILVGFVAGACSSVHYSSTTRRWTEGSNVYSAQTFNAKLMWRATYLSPEWRAVAREKVLEWKRLTPDSTTSFAHYITEVGEGDFLLSVYTPKGYPPLISGIDPFWELVLTLPTGESYTPSSVESVNVTPREKRLFPHVNRWSRFYKVSFPIYDIAKPFSLSLRSVAVTSTLTWK